MAPASKAGELGEVVSEVEIQIQGYSTYLLDVLRKSPRTVDEYVKDVRRWLGWWKRPVEFFKDSEWDDWTASMSAAGLAGSSIKRYRVSVRRFFKYLRKRRILHHDPAINSEPVERRKTLPTWLLESEVDCVISKAISVRNRAILEVLYSCGLRNEECRAITLDSIRGNVLQVLGKGRKERIVPIPARARAALDKWLLERPADTDLAFASTHKRQMSSRTLNILVHKLVKAAGITKRVTPHTLRHSIATHLASRGVPIDRIQLFLGHESPETTMIYVHLAQSLVHQSILDAHPHR